MGFETVSRSPRSPELIERHPSVDQAEIPPQANGAGPVRPHRFAATSGSELVLEHTLLITTAATEDQLVTRTLAAACAVTGAPVAAALTPTQAPRTEGDPVLADRLATAARGPLDLQPGGLTSAFAPVGLPSAVTMPFGDRLIVLASPVPDQFDAASGSLLALIVAHALAAIDRLEEHARLSRQAQRDPLTGVPHYRPFEERLGTIAPGRTAVIAVDVDDFKKINDQYGHQAGDHALLSLVEALRTVLRDQDQLYRIGGDEFAVILEVSGASEVVAIARRLLEAAREVGQTVSVGAAVQLFGETGRETLLRADKALYQAKRSGRDTARVA
jgi:diguanylate cyclase (GGDEF)-like protein